MKTLQEIYDGLPSIECKGKCTAQCSVVPTKPDEKEFIIERYGEEGIPEPQWVTPKTPVCNQLTDDGRCSIYDARPLICRLWGLVKHPLMRCPHGCTPDKWVPKRKADKLLDIVKEGIKEDGESKQQTDSQLRKAIEDVTD